MQKKREFKIGIILFFMLGTAIFGGAYFIKQGSRQAIHDELPLEKARPSALKQWSGHIQQSVRQIIIKQAEKGIMDSKKPDLSKLDFSKKGEETYGDVPELEVFHPNGGNANSQIPYIDDISEKPEIIFTAGNRIKNAGSEKEDLIVIVTNIRPHICKEIHEYLYESKAVSNPQIENLSRINMINTQKRVDDDMLITLNDYQDCVQVNDKHYYYSLVLEQ